MYPFLPKLKSSVESDKIKKLQAFDKRGIWDIGGRGDLSDLADSLDVGKFDPNYFEVDSIPDIWARPLLFEMAFFDKSHLLHERIIQEWRGLLAMLALKEIRALPIDTVEIKIPKSEKQKFQSEEDKEIERSSPDFLQALGALAPDVFIAEDTDWYQIFVILFRGRPIGMTSPTTLVCTAVSCFNRIFDVPWFNSRLLVDPVPFLNYNEKMSLIGWLDYLSTNFSNHQVRSDQYIIDMRTYLNKEIDAFQRDLGLKEGENVEPPQLSSSGIHLEYGIYVYLDKPIKPVEEEISHVKLIPSRKEPMPSPNLLVIDKKIAKDWGMKEQDVIVFGSYNLSSVPYSGLKDDTKKFGDKPLRGAEWIKPEMFFTQKLFYLEQGDALPGCVEIEGMQDMTFEGHTITPIIPLQP